MSEKYDLKKMLEEIKEDLEFFKKQDKNTKLSQEEIKKLLKERKNAK